MKEWTIDMCDNMAISHKHYIEWKKPDLGEYIWYDTFIWSPETAKINGDRHQNGGCLWGMGSEMIEIFCIFIRLMVTQV